MTAPKNRDLNNDVVLLGERHQQQRCSRHSGVDNTTRALREKTGLGDGNRKIEVAVRELHIRKIVAVAQLLQFIVQCQ